MFSGVSRLLVMEISLCAKLQSEINPDQSLWEKKNDDWKTTSGSWMRTWHSRHLPQHPSCQVDRSTEEQRFRQAEQGRKDVLLQWSHLQCHVHVFTSDTTLDVVANRDHNCSFKNSGHGWVWYSCSDLMSERAKHSEKQQDGCHGNFNTWTWRRFVPTASCHVGDSTIW